MVTKGEEEQVREVRGWSVDANAKLLWSWYQRKRRRVLGWEMMVWIEIVEEDANERE